ncbi:gluconolactonase [Micromonospora inositola]|uniref:Gluconolactonase n=1 Tax=Micromonospora inositola TaxID=47865 RepID=A0A1C5JWN0_9ACTN|nr:gluconolactonase [Micromonospora inositola]
MTTDVRIHFDGLFTEPRLDHAEGVAVAPDGTVWCGGEQGQIYRLADGRFEQVASTGGFCLGLALDAAGHVFVCDAAHAAVMRLDTVTGQVDTFADGVPGHRFVNPNYPVFDTAGRLYVSDSGTPHVPGPGIARLEPDGGDVLWHRGPFDFANGLALSADGRTLYVAETWGHRVTAIDITADGAPGARRVLARLGEALPDGLALDTDGNLYVACYEPSQILVVAPGGAVSVLARDPGAHELCHPTNVAFLGSTLIAANLGRWHLSAIETGATGLPLGPFRDKGTRP